MSSSSDINQQTASAALLPPKTATANGNSAAADSSSSTHSEKQPKPKKKLNRQLASCSGCRKRRTRCDRGRPCSECHKRNVNCDYTGATAPPAITHAAILEQVEREEYIKQLEARLQLLERGTSGSPTTSNPPAHSHPPQDFTVDDIAAQLSLITIGRRVRCQPAGKEPHQLRTQLESVLASQSNIPPSPSSNRNNNSRSTWLDWNIQLNAFWNTPDRLSFRPSSSPRNPPHLTQHYLAQFISVIYGVIGHGLARLADIHHLESAAENQSSVGSSTSSPPRDYHLWNLNQAEKISLSNRWFRFSLGLLMSPEGNIYVKPTVFGIRAMSILSNVEHAPENVDHGMFFWSLTSSLAASAGLLQEPPISDDEELQTLDEIEVESRRQLAWAILALDWAGHSIAGGTRPYQDPDQITVKIPGTVLSPNTPLHPNDGWPLDPLLCIRKLAAQMDKVMRKNSFMISSGRLATYEDVTEGQMRIQQVESSVPPRLQARISADGKSLETVVKSDPIYTLLATFLHSRFCIPQIRLLRLFIFPKPGVPPEERIKQLNTLLAVSKRHFLAVEHYPHSLSMHPLIIYGLINTAVACALVLLTNHQTHELTIEEDFFLTQLNKLIALFDLGKKTIAVSMARKAVALLQTLIKQIELRSTTSGSKSWDRRKKGPAVAAEPSENSSSADVGVEVKKRKQQKPKVPPKPQEPANFQSLPCGIGMPSVESSHAQAVQPHHRRASEQMARYSISSSHGLMSTSPRIIPVHTSPLAGIHHSELTSSEAFPAQPTPPLVPSQPNRRPGFSTHSSSSHHSLPDRYLSLDHPLNCSPSFRPVASLPRHHNNQGSTISCSYGGYGSKLGGQPDVSGADEGTANEQHHDSLNLLEMFDPGFVFHLPNWTRPTEPTTSELEHFQPTFNPDFAPFVAPGLPHSDPSDPRRRFS
ncbi:hypothetical protein PCASD_22718 [Puccinia coronata f. sp. avenae]|uniref:Zn(2)-C6 fungal-type domain-containing protein n=1 Tax=Puccinia coronata f. sp. avenae TaxID=200324 RepID=A0A2N5SEA9_9BASI|nr:hypothetical protein PCASD_22718 [Puccinia coronata f. sp. avenae]